MADARQPSPQLGAQQRRWVEQALPRVRPLALHMARNLPSWSPEELQSIGNEALVRAALRYDPESGVPFARYAHYRMRGAMIDATRSRHRAGRQANRARRALESTQALLEEASQSGAPERASLAERVAAAKALVEKTTAAAMLSRARDAEVEKVADGGTPDAEDLLLGSETRQRVRALVAGLDPDARMLVQAIYFDGRTMQSVADEIGKSLATVSRRHSKLLGVLAARMRADP